MTQAEVLCLVGTVLEGVCLPVAWADPLCPGCVPHHLPGPSDPLVHTLGLRAGHWQGPAGLLGWDLASLGGDGSSWTLRWPLRSLGAPPGIERPGCW